MGNESSTGLIESTVIISGTELTQRLRHMGKFTGGKKRLPAIEFLFYFQREREGGRVREGPCRRESLRKAKGEDRCQHMVGTGDTCGWSMMRDCRDRGSDCCSTTLLQICLLWHTRDTREPLSLPLSLSLTHTRAHTHKRKWINTQCTNPVPAPSWPIFTLTLPFLIPSVIFGSPTPSLFRVIPSWAHMCKAAAPFYPLSFSLSNVEKKKKNGTQQTNVYLMFFHFFAAGIFE